MKLVAGVLTCVLASCGSSKSPTSDRREDLCTLVADRLEERLRIHQADLPRLRAWSGTTLDERLAHQNDPALNDAVATYQTAWQVAPFCANVLVTKECPQLTPPSLLKDVDGSFRTMRALLDGMRRRGPCAGPTRPGELDCEIIEMQLGEAPGYLAMVREGWSTPSEAYGLPTRYAGFAVERMASWRALVDYGVAVAPVCARREPTTCDRLREGLPEASPDDLVASMHVLLAAFLADQDCANPSAPEASGRSTARADAGATR